MLKSSYWPVVTCQGSRRPQREAWSNQSCSIKNKPTLKPDKIKNSSIKNKPTLKSSVESQAQAGDLIARLNPGDPQDARTTELFNVSFPILGTPAAMSDKVYQKCVAFVLNLA
ncbi:hypothetical protein Tco_0737737 [Tanacetum coccineum]